MTFAAVSGVVGGLSGFARLSRRYDSALADTAGKLARLSTDGLDAMTARRAAYSIKRSSATLGVFRLSRLAGEIEQSAEGTRPERLRGSVHELRRSFLLASRFVQVLLPAKEIAR